MTDKTVTVQNKSYVIRRYTLGERKDILKKSQDNAENSEYAAWTIYYGIKEPKFKDIAEVYALDADVADELFAEVIEYNLPSEAFLTRLQSLSSRTRRISDLQTPQKP